MKKSGETIIKRKKNVLHHIQSLCVTAKKSKQPVVCYIHARPDTPAHQGGTASTIRTISIEDHQ